MPEFSHNAHVSLRRCASCGGSHLGRCPLPAALVRLHAADFSVDDMTHDVDPPDDNPSDGGVSVPRHPIAPFGGPGISLGAPRRELATLAS